MALVFDPETAAAAEAERVAEEERAAEERAVEERVAAEERAVEAMGVGERSAVDKVATSRRGLAPRLARIASNRAAEVWAAAEEEAEAEAAGSTACASASAAGAPAPKEAAAAAEVAAAAAATAAEGAAAAAAKLEALAAGLTSFPTELCSVQQAMAARGGLNIPLPFLPRHGATAAEALTLLRGVWERVLELSTAEVESLDDDATPFGSLGKLNGLEWPRIPLECL